MNLETVNLKMVLPPAVHPPEVDGRRRDQVKLMVIDRAEGTRHHGSLWDLSLFLNEDDLIVVNDSMAIGAALPVNINHSPHYMHLAARLSSHRIVSELRTAKGAPDSTELPLGTIVTLSHPLATSASMGVITSHFHRESRLWTLDTSEDWYKAARELGQPIRYHYLDAPYPLHYYSTLFGKVPGSSEMASASRPFTPALLENLSAHQVRFASLTLHTTVSSHEIDATTGSFPLVPEWYHIPLDTRAQVLKTRANHGRVIALGTTVARALESWATSSVSTGWTRHLITPETPPRITSALITGLHDSFSSHLLLLYAYASEESIRAAYEDAAMRQYQWHEFGDLSLIL